MSPSITQHTDRYYQDFASKGDFASVPMADDFKFRGPIHTYTDGDRYRTECKALASNVVAITIRHQIYDKNQVHTVYDFDLGLPTGPVATSETLTYDTNGMMIAADLYLDSTPLRPPSAS